jgi:hypothetical protein
MDLGSRTALPCAARSDSAEAISAVIPGAVFTVRTFRDQARLRVVTSPQAKIASKHSETLLWQRFNDSGWQRESWELALPEKYP